MTMQDEPAIADAGAVIIEVFAIFIQLMVSVVIFRVLCVHRYDKDEHLTMSFAHDLQNLSKTKLSDSNFLRKIIRYARYSLAFQWMAYITCHILILSHEFLTEPVLVDHLIYITFILSLTFLFLTFRNIGIYYFTPFTDDKNFRIDEFQQGGSPALDSTQPNNGGDSAFATIDEDLRRQMHREHDDELVTEESGNIGQNGVDSNAELAGNRFSHHHWDDDDLKPDPVTMVPKTGNADVDDYNSHRMEIRMNFIHLFRSVAYTVVVFWVGYIVAAVHGDNSVVLATLALMDVLYFMLVCMHMWYVRQLMKLLQKYERVFVTSDEECNDLREQRMFSLDRWFRADIGILCVIVLKFVIMVARIPGANTSFAWPASHPVFLATTLVAISSLQMTCCRYIWFTKED